MSHLVTIATQIRDQAALTAACSRLKLAPPVHGKADIFTTEVTGLIVELPDWCYPVVIDIPTAQVHFDNYGGRWGEQRHLDRLVQAYAAEKAILEARKAGRSVTEELLADGSIKLTVQVSGGVS